MQSMPKNRIKPFIQHHLPLTASSKVLLSVIVLCKEQSSVPSISISSHNNYFTNGINEPLLMTTLQFMTDIWAKNLETVIATSSDCVGKKHMATSDDCAEKCMVALVVAVERSKLMLSWH